MSMGTGISRTESSSKQFARGMAAVFKGRVMISLLPAISNNVCVHMSDMTTINLQLTLADQYVTACWQACVLLGPWLLDGLMFAYVMQPYI